MDVYKILKKIRNNSCLICRAGSNRTGPTIEIKLPDESGKYIVGLVPIDNESDERFADYLMDEAWEAVSHERHNDLSSPKTS